jgi:NADH dehydrogenase
MRKRIVILGGGFAGSRAARRLDNTLARRTDVEVVLIARENYLLFTPMLHEVAAGDLAPGDIVQPLRKMLRRVRVIAGDVVQVDLRERRVRFEVGALRRKQELTYDHLLLALGSETNWFGMRELAAHAVTMKSLGDAALLRNRMVAFLEDAAAEPDQIVRRRALAFVVAGAGFAGVETVAAMNDFLREAIRYYPELDPAMLRVVLVGSGKYVLPELGEQLGRYAKAKLERRGIEVRLETRVKGYESGAVQLEPGGAIEANTIVWTAGVKPAAAIDALDVEKVNGRMRVNEFLELAGNEGVVWAAGDCAAVPDPGGGLQPPTAQHGLRQAVAAAKNIEAAVAGTAKAPFRFATIGQFATIGRRDGVARVLGIRISGFVAWCIWRMLYLAKLPGVVKKLRVAMSWSLDLLFGREIEQFLTVRDVERMEALGAQLRTMRDREAGSEECPQRRLHLVDGART